MGTITLHFGQYSKIFNLKDGQIVTIETQKNGRRFNSFLVPEPISRIIYSKYLDYAPHASTGVKIEQRLTGKDLA